ncbi:hypothetical protein IWZ03DRAFT_360069 [Phyllosticta citriasiana]|uniref:Heterokaryon incompatibility domain-containing protein n=1 Tax=Phyllosticta citriasiana TaxID=595635 RepID=A0ABR1KPM7_9PEZI
MSSSPFPYRPLQAQTQEIRIIQVLPLAEESHESPQVHCKLKQVDLVDEPEYSALSYVWGDTRATKSIILDDRQIGVTANLEIALRQLVRNLYDKREKLLDLWVDAICIDQANASEKTQQLVLSRSQVQFDPEADLVSDIGAIQRSLDDILTVLCSDDMRLLHALGNLFDRQWFRRVWVLQEAALSTNGFGMVGRALFDARHLEVGFNMLCGLREYLRIAATGRCSPVADFLTRKLGRATAVVFSRGTLHMRHLLYLLANPDAPLEASDERDYIFALLGLATDAEELGIRSDYSKTWSEIRVDVARTCLKHYNYGIELLFFCKPGSHPSGRESVPSWAPNWSPRHLPRPLSIRSRFSFVRGGGWRNNAYNACGETVSRISDESFLPNGSTNDRP